MLRTSLLCWVMLLVPGRIEAPCADSRDLPEAQRRRPKETEEPPRSAGSSTGWRWGASLRSRAERWDWFDPDPSGAGSDDAYAFLGSYARLSLSRATRRADIFFEGSIPLLLGLPRNATAPAPQGQLGHGAAYRDANADRAAFVFLRQAHVTFKGLLDGKTRLRLGRFEFIEGQESMVQDATLDWIKRERIASRLVANFAFTHVQRTFDGLELGRSTQTTNLTIMAARPTQGVFKLDANREVPDVDVVYAGLTRTGRARDYDVRLFYVYYRDDRGVVKVDNRPAAARSADRGAIALSTVGGHYTRRAGRTDLLGWGAWQGGDWGAQRQKSWAWVAEAGYQPGIALEPWVRVGANHSSGDRDPGDGQHQTFFQMLPTARIYARFPFFNMMNVDDDFVQLLLRPHPRVTLRTDLRSLRLHARGDLWYAGGGVFDGTAFGFGGKPSGGARGLARLVDGQIDYRPDGKTVLTFYFGHARGGSVIRGIHPAGANANLAYWEIARRF